MSVSWLKNCSKPINFDHFYFTLLQVLRPRQHQLIYANADLCDV
jgi:hypothetical protein